jgi:hypothetical protein
VLRECEAQPQSKDPFHHHATAIRSRRFYCQSGYSIFARLCERTEILTLNRNRLPTRLHGRINFMASGSGRLRSFAIVIALSASVFALMQLLFGGSHCYDCGATIGFPFFVHARGNIRNAWTLSVARFCWRSRLSNDSHNLGRVDVAPQKGFEIAGVPHFSLPLREVGILIFEGHRRIT